MPFFRISLVLAAVLTLAAPALPDGAFAPLAEEYLERIGDQYDVEERTALVDKVSLHGNRDAAKLLIDSVQILSDRIDEVLKKLEKAEKAHEELNTNQDVAKDDYKSRTKIRREIMNLEEKVTAHRKVVERIRKSLIEVNQIPAQEYVSLMAVKGTVWRQRGIAAHASAIYPTDSGREGAVKALKDKEPRVVIQALYGLRERKDIKTLEAVCGVFKKGVWVVQSLAAETVAEINSPKGIRHLIEALGKATGRLQQDINESLRKLTGQKFDPEYEAWKGWYEENKAEIEGDGAKPLARRRGGAADPDDSSYYGIKTRSKRIVYVIDISGSMNLEIGGGGVSSPRAGERERLSGPKIEIAKKELKMAIRKLPEDAYFNIITFNHLVKNWDVKMVKATQANKNKAYLFIRELKASGSTYTYGALKEAFKLAGMGANDPNYASGVDTVFLLSDGAPTDQAFPMSKLMDPEKILTAVEQWNALSKVIIHAIAIDPKTQGGNFIKFMKLLATRNNGKYMERG